MFIFEDQCVNSCTMTIPIHIDNSYRFSQHRILRIMFNHWPVVLIAVVVGASAYVLPHHGTGGLPGGASDVCHNAQTYTSSLHSLMGLCDGVSSSASGKLAELLNLIIFLID